MQHTIYPLFLCKTNFMIPNQISLQEAIALTSRYRTAPVTAAFFSEVYDGASVLALLNQPGCRSFRVYLGRKPDQRICTVLVGVDANGHDILPPTGPANFTVDEGILLEEAIQCPPICPTPSPLNE